MLHNHDGSLLPTLAALLEAMSKGFPELLASWERDIEQQSYRILNQYCTVCLILKNKIIYFSQRPFQTAVAHQGCHSGVFTLQL